MLNIVNVKIRKKFQRPDGKGREIDVVAESSCGRVVVVEVKKTKDPAGIQAVKDLQEKVEGYAACHPENPIIPAFLSLGGFTDEARRFCEEHSIGMAEKIHYIQEDE